MVIKHETPPLYDGPEADFWRNQDLKENQESRPPEGEEVLRPVVMLAECFVGGDLEGLVEGCRDLGMPEEWQTGRPDIYSWARQVRQTSRTGGWLDIGTAYRSSCPRKWMDDIPVEMSEDFERVLLRAFSPTPSVVFLVATFVLTPQAARLVDDELRTNRFLRLEKRGSVTQYHSAAHRKSDAASAERARVKEEASTWLAQSFAGTLSKDFGLTSLPCIEFITTRALAPFEKAEQDDGWTDHRFLLSIDTDAEAWESASIPGWRLGMPWRPKDDPWTIVAGCQAQATLDQEQDRPGASHPTVPDTEPAVDSAEDRAPKPRESEEHHLVDYFSGLLLRFATLCLIVQYEVAFGTLRDQLASPEPPSPRALTMMDSAQDTLSTLSFDASLVAHELRTWATDAIRWQRNELDPTPATLWKREHYPDHPSLLQVLSESVTSRAEWVLDLESRARDQLTILSSLMATNTGLRLQRIALATSLIALVVACLSLAIR